MALRRRYPQIYGSSVKLKLDVTSIVLGPGDFSKAMRTIVPASQRALAPPGRALSPILRPLLASSFSLVLKALLRVFPHAHVTDGDNTQGKDLQATLTDSAGLIVFISHVSRFSRHDTLFSLDAYLTCWFIFLLQFCRILRSVSSLSLTNTML